MSVAAWLNTAWMRKCGLEGAAFARASRGVARAQAELLRQIVRANRDSAFGTIHRFADVTDPRTYQRRVPPGSYEDFAGPIRWIFSGEANVLTREPVRLLEPTSGTSGGEKLIPYTEGLRRQFQRGVAAWIADLFRHRPLVRRGRAFWSISPALGPRRITAGGIPIGFADDASYLGSLERLALDRLLVVPGEVARLTDSIAFRYATLLALLRADDLALISVWSPTFLTALLGPLPRWADRLCHDLRRGTFQPPAPVPPEIAPRLRGRPDPRRAGRLAAVFRRASSLPEMLAEVWPGLALISCWADAAAARCVREVRELFPAIEIQPKGLLATEGCVSLPLTGRPAPVLALRSHFFEFQEGDTDECRLAHKLQEDGRYRVVLTTGGGFYRYRLGDEVEVMGFEGVCPLVRFLGKADRVSDLVGEKLAEPHVRSVLDRVFAAHGLTPRFALLVPVMGCPSRYCLFLQETSVPSALLLDVQRGLEDNPYYKHATGLGQLAPVEMRLLDPAGESGWLVFQRHCEARGAKAGTVKPTALDAWTGWSEEFRPLVAGKGEPGPSGPG